VVSFFNDLEIKKPCSKTYVSFLNEVASKTQKLSLELGSFFNELEIRKLCSKTSVSFFNEVASKMQNLSSEPLFLIMDSKRTMLRNDTMSRDKTRSWLPRGLHWKEETHSGRKPCRGSRQE
jgi:hypothetical protein